MLELNVATLSDQPCHVSSTPVQNKRRSSLTAKKSAKKRNSQRTETYQDGDLYRSANRRYDVDLRINVCHDCQKREARKRRSEKEEVRV